MTFTDFNNIEKAGVAKLLSDCCGSTKWQRLLIEEFPFADEISLIKKAEDIWYNQCVEPDWLEAFAHHPKIGDIKSLTEKFAATKDLAANEQAGMNTASEQLIRELSNANAAYQTKFGFIFIVCATGKSAAEMLRLLLDRFTNSRNEELDIAVGEQHKITILRFKKFISGGNWQSLKISQLTTHVLDTSLGKPGQNLTIRLKKSVEEKWMTIAQGITNADGRLADLLPAGKNIPPGNYKMVFETANYFAGLNIKGFYPEVEIQFTVFDYAHYHVPLLINPFGYSTYRGS